MGIKQLNEKRGAALKQADLVIQGATREKRELTSAEDHVLTTLKAEVFDIDNKLARAQTELHMDTSRDLRSRDEMSLETYSLCRAIRSAGNGRLDGFEAEVSQELQHRSGNTPNGFFVPSDLLADTGRERRAMSVTGDAGVYGANFVATEKRGFVDALRNILVCASAGATVLDGLHANVDIPRQSAASTALWKSEVASLGESTPTIDQLELRPRRVGSYTVFSKRLLAQSSIDIENMIRTDLLSACATALDAAAINGAGTTEPVGILGTSGIGNVIGGTNGAAPDWADIVALIAALEGTTFGGKTAFVINAATAAKLRSTPRVASTDSRMILEGNDLLGHPVLVSNSVPSNLTKGSSSGVCSAIIYGDFTNLCLASFGDALDVVVDPFTNAVQGQTRIVVNSYVDAGVRQPGAFAVMKDALTA